MLNYNEMIKCGQKYAFEKKKMTIEKYKAFLNYIQKIINIVFENNEEQVASYLKESGNSQSFLLDWNTEGIHYDGFVISAFGKMIDIDSLKAHDSYYDPVLKLASYTDDELIQFFDKEYLQFVTLFIPTYCDEELDDEKPMIDESRSIVCQITNRFNEACFDHFKIYFSSLDINNIKSFIESKFALSYTEERRRELDKEVLKCYDSYSEKLEKLRKQFEDSVKVLK